MSSEGAVLRRPIIIRLKYLVLKTTTLYVSFHHISSRPLKCPSSRIPSIRENHRLLTRPHHLTAANNRMRRQHALNIAEPTLKPPIPLDRHPQRLIEPRALLPAQGPQLAPIDGVPPVVELAVARVADPGVAVALPSRQPEQRQQLLRQLQVRDLVVRVDVVRLPDRAAVQDRVEGFGSVARVQVAPRVPAVAVQEEGLRASEEGDEFGDYFWGGGLEVVLRSGGRRWWWCVAYFLGTLRVG